MRCDVRKLTIMEYPLTVWYLPVFAVRWPAGSCQKGYLTQPPLFEIQITVRNFPRAFVIPVVIRTYLSLFVTFTEMDLIVEICDCLPKNTKNHTPIANMMIVNKVIIIDEMASSDCSIVARPVVSELNVKPPSSELYVIIRITFCTTPRKATKIKSTQVGFCSRWSFPGILWETGSAFRNKRTTSSLVVLVLVEVKIYQNK